MAPLIDKINIILNDEQTAYAANGRRRGGLGTFNIGIGGAGWRDGSVPQFIEDTSSLEAIHSKNAIILLKLYATLSNSEKIEFHKTLISYLSKQSLYHDVAYLIFFVLHRTGNTIEAIQNAQKYLKGDPNYGFSNMLGVLSRIVQYEYGFISQNLLEEIKKILSNEDEHNFQLLQRINSAQLAHISTQLEANSGEINEDKQALKQEFTKYNFPPDLSDTLDKIDEKINTARDNFDYKGCMDLIRSFTERFYRIIALNLDKECKLDEKDSKAVARFLKEKSVISDDQGEILIALRHFLSNFGSHRLKSRPEDARLSRNMVIEFSLYILRRYEDIKTPSSEF